ncbi:MAG: PilZ domain-containing protein [Candidatus Gygaella obscura]|nr:PilZ domain-containing protein [Candidatus Gygaella obscura]
MDNDLTQNKRNTNRLRMHLPITYKVMSNPKFGKTVTKDISKSGMRMISENFIPPLTELTLQINLFSKILNPTAKVIWSQRLPYSDRYQVGVKFDQINGPESRYLEDYLLLHE